MLRHRANDWLWDDQPLGLNGPEATLLMMLLLNRTAPHPPHVLLARARNRPVSPAAGRAYLVALRRRLIWLGAPIDGGCDTRELPVSQDGETLAALGLQVPSLRGTAAVA